MKKPTLVILAAGVGSRYGGLKQLDTFSKQGDTILDFSIYDAIQAGFGKVVFIIRKSIEDDFKSFFNEKLKGKIEVEYVFQELDKIPEKYKDNQREKPWGNQWTADWGFVKEKYPLMLTEIGFCGADDVGAHIPVISDESYGDAITTYADEKEISYVVWVFDAKWAPRLFEDWKTYKPSRQGKYFKAKLKSYKYD